MSKTIDEKVVSMQFDNSKFEKNVQTSMSTLDKLKAKLNLSDSAKGLENINASVKKVDMNPLANGVETVRAKFSAMEVIAVTALANITNSAVNAGKNLVSSLTIDQVTAGWQKYEQKTSSVQTIMNATGKSIDEVNSYLEKLMWYSDETSYGFTDMTASIAQLTSAGGDIDKLVPMVMGIANATAFAGKGAQEFSRAIYNLNQSYSAGFLQYMDWKSLDLAGVSSKQLKQTFIDTAKALGKLDAEGRTASGTLVEIGNFGQTLQEKWADTSVMEAAFGKFSTLTEAAYKKVSDGTYDTASEAIAALSKDFDELSVKAFKSAQEAKSFGEAIEATKDAVSTGWMKTSEILFGNYEEAKKTWTDLSNTLWDIFASGGEKRNEFLSEALNSKWEKLTAEIEKCGVSADDFSEQVVQTARDQGVAIDDLIDEYGSLGAVISNGKLSKAAIIETLKKFTSVQKEVVQTTDDVTGKLEYFQSVVNKVINGDYGNGATRIQALADAGYDYATVQGLVNKVWERSGKSWANTTITMDDLTGAIGELSDTELKGIGYTEDQIEALRNLAKQAEETGTPINELINSLEKPSGRELFIGTFRNALQGLVGTLDAIKNAWSEIFTYSPNQLYKILETVNALSQKLVLSEESADKLKRSFKGLFAVIDIVTTITGGALRIALKFVAQLLGMVDVNVLDVTAAIGDAIVKFRDWLLYNNKVVKALGIVANALINTVRKIREWVQAFAKLPEVQSAIDKVQNGFTKLYTAIKEYFGEGIKRIGEFIDKVKEMDSIDLKSFGSILKGFKDDVIDYFFDIDLHFNNFVDLFDGLGIGLRKKIDKGVAQPLLGVGVTLESVKSSIFSWFGDIGKKFNDVFGWGEILTVVLGGSLVLTSSKIAKALKSMSKPFETFMNLGAGLNGVLANTSKALKGFVVSLKVKTLLQAALGIAILAGSIALLTLLDPGKMWSAVGAVAALGVALIGITAAMKLIEKIPGSEKGSFSFVAMAGAILILVVALKAMESLDSTKIWDNVGVISALMLALTLCSAILGKAGGTMQKGALTLIAFALSLKILVGVLKEIDTSTFNNLSQSLGVLIASMLALTVLTAVAKGIGAKQAMGVLAIVIALKVLISAFKDIAALDPRMMEKNIASFILIFGQFAILMALSRFAGKNAASAGLGILAMSASLILIVGVIKLLAKMDSGDLAKGLFAVTSMLLVFGAIVALSKFAGQYAAKAGTMLLMMAGTMVILTMCIVVLSHVKDEGLAKAVGAIVALELAFGILITMTRYAGDMQKVQGTLIVLSITIGILAIALGTLSMIDGHNLAMATGAIVAVSLMMAILIASTKYAGSAIGSLIVLTVAISALGGMIYLLTSIPSESAISASASLSLAMLALAGTIAIIGKFDGISRKALISIAAMGLVVLEIGLIFGALQALNIAPSIEACLGLSAMMVAMSGACAIMSKIPVSAAKKGAISLVIFVGIVGGLVAAIGVIAGESNEILSNGVEALGMIGYAIGNFAGSILGGLAAGASSGLPTIAQNLSDFMDDMGPFLQACSSITPESVAGVKMLAETVTTLVKASFWDGLASLFSDGGKSSIEVFADQLKPFGEGIMDFSTAVDGVKVDSITAAAEAGKALADMADTIPSQGGTLQKILGAKDMADFGEKIKTYGTAIVEFSSTVEGLKIEPIETASAAGKSLSELANTLPSADGFAQSLLGSKDIGMFGQRLESYGYGLSQYSSYAEQIDTDAIVASVPCGQSLSELAAGLPSSGLAQSIFGGQDIGKFGKNLIKFGEGMKDYGDKAAEFNNEAIKNSRPSADILVQLANSIPDQSIISSGTLSAFGSQVASFGYYAKQYGGYVKDIPIDQINSATESFKQIASFATSIAGSDFGGLGDLGTALTSVGSNSVGAFVSAFDGASTQLSTAGSNMAKKVVDGAKVGIAAFKTTGKDSVNEFKNGINGEASGIKTAVKTMATNSAEAAKEAYNSFYNAGSYLVDGFSNGISANTWKAKAKSKAMARAAEIAAKRALGIHSPSKVFDKIGSRVPEGMAKGIDRMGDLVKDSSIAMAKKALDGTRKAISRISDLVNSDIDAQPTIRPVLDLSDIRSGAGAIGNLLGGDIPLNTMSNVNAISSMMRNGQNGTNDDVVSAINSLGKQLAQSTGNTYNSINGVTYDDGSRVSEAIGTLVRAMRIERRS